MKKFKKDLTESKGTNGTYCLYSDYIDLERRYNELFLRYIVETRILEEEILKLKQNDFIFLGSSDG